MSKIKDLTGKKFGMIEVVKLDKIENRRTYWLCKCGCGKTFVRRSDIIQNKQIKSCGCYQKENNKIIGVKHGDSRRNNVNPIYHIWQGMKDRCYNKNNPNSIHWLGRGIKVCNEWKNNYLSFKKWALENGYKKGLSLDRIDVNGNYEPTNCRWVTIEQQNKNTTRTKHITYKNKIYTVPEFASLFDVHPETVRYWLYRKNKTLKEFIEHFGGDVE